MEAKRQHDDLGAEVQRREGEVAALEDALQDEQERARKPWDDKLALRRQQAQRLVSAVEKLEREARLTERDIARATAGTGAASASRRSLSLGVGLALWGGGCVWLMHATHSLPLGVWAFGLMPMLAGLFSWLGRRGQ